MKTSNTKFTYLKWLFNQPNVLSKVGIDLTLRECSIHLKHIAKEDIEFISFNEFTELHEIINNASIVTVEDELNEVSNYLDRFENFEQRHGLSSFDHLDEPNIRFDKNRLSRTDTKGSSNEENHDTDESKGKSFFGNFVDALKTKCQKMFFKFD